MRWDEKALLDFYISKYVPSRDKRIHLWKTNQILTLIKDKMDKNDIHGILNLGLGGCQLRSLKGTKRHWSLGFLH